MVVADEIVSGMSLLIIFMKHPKLFKFNIQTSLLTYCDEDKLYEFVEYLRNDKNAKKITLPIIDKTLVDVTEILEEIDNCKSDFFLENYDFDNGKICKLVKVVSKEESNDEYLIKLVSTNEAICDAKNFEFCDEFFKDPIFGGDYSADWLWVINKAHYELRKYGKILKNPTTFPRINDYEPESLMKKCKIVDDLYDSWSEDRHLNNADIKNRLDYYFLRYPTLNKFFDHLKYLDTSASSLDD